MEASIQRHKIEERIARLSGRYPVTAILGARQTGKTTLCRDLASSRDHYFDLERTLDAARLADNALTVLGNLPGCVVIDEAQEMPELFKTLRVLADRPDRPTRFIITGSVAPALMHSISESLAGRVALIEIGGLDLEDTGPDNWNRLWLRGGHPPAFLAESDAEAFEWREFMLDQIVGKDFARWSRLDLQPARMRKLLELVADANGQAWNHSEAAKLLGINYKTVQSHIELLKGAYLIRELPPFEANVRKRLRKSPTLLFRDTGNLHNYLRISGLRHLQSHPRRGFSWEAFGTEQVIRLTETRESRCFRYSVQGGAEIDLVLDLPGQRIGFEFKSSDAPRVTESMRAGCKDLDLTKLYVVFPGDIRSALDGRIEALGIERLPEVCRGMQE